MNRRNFIRSLITIPLAAKLPNISAPIISSIRIENYDDFVYYYIHSFRLYVNNPRACAVIDNLRIPDGY